jgi:hypothetical protein
MMAENPTWGAPRIHGELLMLGFDVSERSVSRWMKRAPRDPELARRWLAFLRNHREAIMAMDFFTVPTVTFNLLYCFFIISHDRRRIVHINHSASHQQLDRAAAKRSVSLPIRSQIPALRSRPKIRSGSTRCSSLAADHGEPRSRAPGKTDWLSAG